MSRRCGLQRHPGEGLDVAVEGSRNIVCFWSPCWRSCRFCCVSALADDEEHDIEAEARRSSGRLTPSAAAAAARAAAAAASSSGAQDVEVPPRSPPCRRRGRAAMALNVAAETEDSAAAMEPAGTDGAARAAALGLRVRFRGRGAPDAEAVTEPADQVSLPSRHRCKSGRARQSG